MGFLGWLFGGKRSKKDVAKKIHKGRNSRKIDKILRDQGFNPDLAYCTECGEWYNVRNQAAVDRHAH